MFVEELKEVKGVLKIEAAGSVRRWRETVGDIDIIVAGEKNCPVMKAFTGHREVAEIIAEGITKSSVRLGNGLQADLRLVAPESFGAAIAYFTGSKQHNILIRDRARDMGLKISEYGIERIKTGKRVGGAEEMDIYRAVKLPWIPPELREARGEIEAAEKGKLPRLVELKDIKGDLQMHTKATDGRNTIEEMARAAKKLGLSYIAITDHSKAVRVANGLDEKRLRKHLKDIEKADGKVPGIRILKGIEVDILPDGSLDLKEDVLRECEVVVGAVHSRFNMSEKEMTERIVKALRSGLIHILAHPTGRLILERDPYPLDLGEVFRVAREEGVAMEINAHPDRLDLRDVDARHAKEVGVKLVISTDAHAANQLELMRFGVHTARRGWLEPEDILNTLPVNKFLRTLRR